MEVIILIVFIKTFNCNYHNLDVVIFRNQNSMITFNIFTFLKLVKTSFDPNLKSYRQVADNTFQTSIDTGFFC